MKLSSLQKGLVGHWTMSQDSLKGSLLADKTPYENDGTIYGATFATDRKGQPNNCMSFDGVDDYVTVASNGLNKFSYQSFTISAWVKPETIQNYTLIWSYDYTSHVSPYYSQHLRIDSSRKIYFYWNNGTLMQNIATPAIISKDVWYHIVATYTSGSQKIYVNSKEEAVGIATDVISYYNQPVWIGKSNFGITKKAVIDDVRIYNRALSETEIKTLYNSYNPKIVMKTSLPKIKLSRALKGTFVDSRDGTEYKTIKIGNQTWMAENLKYLPSVVGPATGSLTDPYYYVYGYNGTDVATAKATTNYQDYGVLYNWTAATTACPAGWHLPSDEEWKTLEMYLGMTQAQADATLWRGNDEGGKLKEAGTTHWRSPNTGATNSSGFTALPAGYRDTGGLFYNIGTNTGFWSSSASGSSYAWRRDLSASYSTVRRYSGYKANGFSVRCLRNY